MISRRRCKQIAEKWAIDRGLEEFHRRMKEVGELSIPAGSRSRIYQTSAGMLLHGAYDPPIPKIPNVFQRLTMDDWTPPMPTPEQWPMRTGGMR